VCSASTTTKWWLNIYRNNTPSRQSGSRRTASAIWQSWNTKTTTWMFTSTSSNVRLILKATRTKLQCQLWCNHFPHITLQFFSACILPYHGNFHNLIQAGKQASLELYKTRNITTFMGCLFVFCCREKKCLLRFISVHRSAMYNLLLPFQYFITVEKQQQQANRAMKGMKSKFIISQNCALS